METLTNNDQELSKTTEAAVINLLHKLWQDGGGDKPVIRVWNLMPNAGGFDKAYDKIQEELDTECGADDFITGFLGKSKGQIMRVAAVLHALFGIQEDYDTCAFISDAAVTAALDLVNVCNEHTKLIAGKTSGTSSSIIVASPGGRKTDIEIDSHILKLPGKVLDLSVLLDKKKFRSYDHKEGAIRGFKSLETDDLGSLVVKHGRNSAYRTYQFRKRSFSEGNEEGGEIASKLAKYSISLPQYVAAMDVTDMPWEVKETPSS